MYKYLLLFILPYLSLCLPNNKATAQTHPIKTVLIHPQDEPLLPPVVELNSGEILDFSFDLLGEEEQALNYRVIHCTPNGEKSAISSFDYIDGFDSGPIEDVEQSFNTSTPYYHYQVSLPNRDMRLLLSGRYRIDVFLRNQPDSTLASASFFVYERKAQSYLQEYNRGVSQLHQTWQQLELTLEGSQWQRQPQQVTAMVVQNYDYAHARIFSSPDEIRGDALVYRSPDKLKFQAGNEFRQFNTNSIEYANVGISQIEYHSGAYHYLLMPDRDLSYNSYQQRPDINGRFRIDAERRSDPDLEADYVYVYFSLPGKPFVAGEKVVLLGAFNQWSTRKEWLLPYNFEEKAYQKRFLLKQGYYNYAYGVLHPNGNLEKHVFSGNHAQTGNHYQAFVFFRSFGSNYDKLISVSQLSVNANELP